MGIQQTALITVLQSSFKKCTVLSHHSDNNQVGMSNKSYILTLWLDLGFHICSKEYIWLYFTFFISTNNFSCKLCATDLHFSPKTIKKTSRRHTITLGDIFLHYPGHGHCSLFWATILTSLQNTAESNPQRIPSYSCLSTSTVLNCFRKWLHLFSKNEIIYLWPVFKALHLQKEQNIEYHQPYPL